MELVCNRNKEIDWEEEVEISLTKKEFALLCSALWASCPAKRQDCAVRYFTKWCEESSGHNIELAQKMTDIINNLF